MVNIIEPKKFNLIKGEVINTPRTTRWNNKLYTVNTNDQNKASKSIAICTFLNEIKKINEKEVGE